MSTYYHYTKKAFAIYSARVIVKRITFLLLFNLNYQIHNFLPLHTISHSTSLSPTTNGISISSNTIIAPNKSSLFNNMSQTTTASSVDRESYSSNLTQQLKPVPNHGKPNCAPKPPGIQQIIASKNGNGNGSSTNGSNGTGRPTVARHHSMKTPR